MKSLTYENEGEKGTVNWSECKRVGVLKNGWDAYIDEVLEGGTYYVEISTSSWLPGIATPTCHGDAVVTYN